MSILNMALLSMILTVTHLVSVKDLGKADTGPCRFCFMGLIGLLKNAPPEPKTLSGYIGGWHLRPARGLFFGMVSYRAVSSQPKNVEVCLAKGVSQELWPPCHCDTCTPH